MVNMQVTQDRPESRGATVVAVLGVLRIGLGVGYALAPRLLTRAPAADSSAVLMTRGFAVREVVIGWGGLRDRARRPALWAGLGALTDAGDLAAAVVAMRSGDRSARPALCAAAAGLSAELVAWGLLRQHGSR